MRSLLIAILVLFLICLCYGQTQPCLTTYSTVWNGIQRSYAVCTPPGVQSGMTTKQRDRFDVAREEASRRMFASSRTWPNLILPVKNYDLKKEGDHFGKLGVIANPASEGLPLVIFETNCFAPDFKNSTKFTYDSVESAIEAGWVVD